MTAATNRVAIRRLATTLAITSACFVLPGCGRGPAMSQVRGKVLYKDGSVPKGGVNVVRLEPTGESTAEVRRGASAMIEPDGSFEMYTRQPGDGVFHGEYAVTFAILRAVTDPKPLIQEKYRYSATTPYKITVDGDLSDLKFEIEPLPGVSGTRTSSKVDTDGSAAPIGG
jgi:hypothetical protein